jgi:hypothetical protein
MVERGNRNIEFVSVSMTTKKVTYPSIAAAMVPGSIIFPFGLLLAGWATQRHFHWIVVDIVRFFDMDHSNTLTISFLLGHSVCRRWLDLVFSVNADIRG